MMRHPIRTAVAVILVVGVYGVADDAGKAYDRARAALAGGGGGAGGRAVHQPAPSPAATSQIPPSYLALYRSAVKELCPGLPWTVLAGVGAAESGHGQSFKPGVRSGVNTAGCCAGPMQFNIRNGPPSTWDTQGDGAPAHVYDPRYAIPAAATYLCRLGATGDPARQRLAVASYNAGPARVRTCGCVPPIAETQVYVARVFAAARSYQKGR